MRLPRVLNALATAAMAMPLYFVSIAPAQEAPAAPAPAAPAAPTPAPAAEPAPAAPAAPAPAAPAALPPTPNPVEVDKAPTTPEEARPSPLHTAIEDFWHYARVARYETAVEHGKKIIDSGATPEDILKTFETVLRTRRDAQSDLYDNLLRWSQVEPMKDISQQLLGKLKEGQKTRYTNPQWIMEQVKRLAINEVAFDRALSDLRQSGEYAAPVLLDVLRDPAQKQLHASSRRALVRLGRQVLNPMVATMESKNSAQQLTFIGILGDLGYADASASILRVYHDSASSPEVKAACSVALNKLGTPDAKAVKPADAMLELAEKFYYSNASIVPDPRFGDIANVWFWDEAKGVFNKEVPAAIFNEIMAMRCCKTALTFDANRSDAISLWLAANNRREADLPEGKTDATYEGPDAHFYNVAMGVQYCNNVLSRSLRDRTQPVAIKVVKSLQEIIGQANMSTGNEAEQPIVKAMSFPERKVRYEAAIALSTALPQASFIGQELVVPTLGEALTSSAKPNLLIVVPDLNAANAIKESLKDAGQIETATDPSTAATAAGRLPGLDVLIIDSRNNPQTDAVMASPRLRGVPVIVIVENRANGYLAAEMSGSLVNTLIAGTAAPTPEALVSLITKVRDRAGAQPLDDKTAETYALRAAEQLKNVAINRSPTLDILTALPALLRALDDSRIEVAKAAAGVLGRVNNKDAQAVLSTKSCDEKTPDDLKVAGFKALASNAKLYGNLLDAAQVEPLQKVVETSTNLQVRSAAAEAQGALNLSADRAKNLIVPQPAK